MGYLSEYKTNATNSNVSKQAFDYIITDLLQKNLTGDAKIRTITGNDMEKSAPSPFVPSMIYAMMYVSQKPSSQISKQAFYDVVPVILCLSCDMTSVTGINFNFMPNEVRANVLDLLSSTKFVSQTIDSGTDEFRINQKLGASLMTGNASQLIAFLKETTGVDISMCVRKYNRKSIIKARLIEYDMWQYIPYLNFTDAVRGVNLAAIQLAVANTSNK